MCFLNFLFVVGKLCCLFYVNMNIYLYKFIINKKLIYRKESSGVVG